MEENAIVSKYKVVIIGGSAGSLEILLQIIPNLQVLKNYALVIVLHRKNGDDTTLEELFALKTEIPVKEVEDKTPLASGNIYIAPSDYHLLFEKSGVLSLDISEKINYSRPSIDVSFESAAEAFNKSVLAILLSGANADGTEGLKIVKQFGGTVVIQNPESASVPFMPHHAISNLEPDAILNVREITALLSKLNS
jgi:two-component system chemotaxis response regulator CheB